MKNDVFWNVTQSVCRRNRRFGGTYRLHHHADKNRRAGINVSSVQQPKHAVKKYRLYVSPKRRFLEEPHGVKSLKTAPFC
jgi:hypothetical protein